MDNQLVKGMPWEEFLKFMKEEWKPGQHMALIATTGQGKSTWAVQVLNQRKYVLALDPKGGDDTLAASGWTRTNQWPPPKKIYDDITEGKPAKLILGRKGANMDELKPEFEKAFGDIANQGGWTVYVDEFQITSDKGMMNLGKPVEKLLVSARFKKVSIVTAYQAPSWVPTASTRQASWIIMWPTRDEDSIKKIAEKAGRNKKEFKQIVDNLPEYHCLVVPPKHTDPMIITKAPPVN